MVLLWALGKVQELPDSATQCDTSVFNSVLPPFSCHQLDNRIR